MNYEKFIEKRLKVVNKEGETVQFILNPIQKRFLSEMTNRSCILKARQQGFSSLILGMFTADFLLTENSLNVVVADNSDNAIALLDRVKFYIRAYEELKATKIPLKYNSKYELYNEANNSRYSIGTAENTEFGRSRTIFNLHMSEAAFYQHFEQMKAGAMQAVVPNGKIIVETTANGFNEFRGFWEESKQEKTGFKPLFFKASDFYSPEFLEQKKKELGRLYKQEYPETDTEAFLTSGDNFFDTESLQWYLSQSREPSTNDLIYA